MINNLEANKREYKLPERLARINSSILGVIEISNKYLILIDDKEDSRESCIRIINAWNHTKGNVGIYVKVTHTKTSIKNVYYLRDSNIEELYSGKGFTSYNKSFITFLKEFSERYNIRKFGEFNCTSNNTYPPQQEPLVLFSNLGTGNIRPSDIDGIIVSGNLLIYEEIKTGNGQLSIGQKLVLERICNAWKNGGGVSIGVLAREVKNNTGDIMASNCNIEKYYKDGKWKNIEMNLVKGLESMIINLKK